MVTRSPDNTCVSATPPHSLPSARTSLFAPLTGTPTPPKVQVSLHTTHAHLSAYFAHTDVAQSDESWAFHEPTNQLSLCRVRRMGGATRRVRYTGSSNLPTVKKIQSSSVSATVVKVRRWWLVPFLSARSSLYFVRLSSKPYTRMRRAIRGRERQSTHNLLPEEGITTHTNVYYRHKVCFYTVSHRLSVSFFLSLHRHTPNLPTHSHKKKFILSKVNSFAQNHIYRT